MIKPKLIAADRLEAINSLVGNGTRGVMGMQFVAELLGHIAALEQQRDELRRHWQKPLLDENLGNAETLLARETVIQCNPDGENC